MKKNKSNNKFLIFTLIIIILILLGIIIFFSNNKETQYVNVVKNITRNLPNTGLFSLPSYSYSNLEGDMLLNPYEGPVRDDRLFQISGGEFPNKVPINIRTQSVDTPFRQVGILTRIGGKETILPLMGRPLIRNRDRWNFYSMSDKNNMIKLPITFKGRKGMDEQGVDNIYDGDIVQVDGYNDAFKFSAYNSNVLKYIPYV